MRVRLLSFGPLKAALPPDGVWVELTGERRVGELIHALIDKGTFTDAAMRSAAVAVNQEYAAPDQILSDGDEVAILPPVSGGAQPVSDRTGAGVSGKPDDLVQIVREPIDTENILNAVKSGGDGAVCVFDGIVRDNTRGRATLHLDYEAYEEMALRQMRMLRDEAIANFGVREVAIVHRLGRLRVGETSVLIAVASAHRAAAFEACRHLIDTLKKTVPIWKREQFVDGAVWADGEPFPEDLTRSGVAR
ncbi:MAG TPA: molybdenum cofactor biosynthesis protein MoaE [Acidobacteriaceae bacterium]|nr:molybdenum cofactor biosynthesis protein MoaE [Acidobacteriaceae bacterium]